MDDHFKNIFKFLKSESLSQNERLQIRNVLLSVMRDHPMQVAPARTHRLSILLSYFDAHAMRPVGYALAFVLVAGLGTTYAAEGALPGDPLYAVKVGMTEPLQGVLAVSPVAKATWNSELVSRRLEEAATLAAKGTLSDEARTQIQSRIILSSEDFSRQIAQLESTDEGVVAAASAQSDLEASLVGHERVLTGLSVDLPKEATAIAPLLQTVRSQAEETNTKRKSTERALTRDENAVRSVATKQKVEARAKVEELRKIAAAKRLQASTSAEASASVSVVEHALEAADRKMEAGQYKEAFNTYQAAIRATRAVEVNLSAQERLGSEIESHGKGRDDGEEDQ